MKKLILIALAALGAAAVAKKQLDKSNSERAQWAEATDTVDPAQKA